MIGWRMKNFIIMLSYILAVCKKYSFDTMYDEYKSFIIRYFSYLFLLYHGED